MFSMIFFIIIFFKVFASLTLASINNESRLLAPLNIITRKVLILSSGLNVSNYNGIDHIYYALDTAFINESLVMASYDQVDLYMYLLNNSYPLQISADNINLTKEFFRDFQGNISFKPLLCSDFNIAGCLIDDSSTITVNLTSVSFIFYITSNFLIKNIIFNGQIAFERSICYMQGCSIIPDISVTKALFEIISFENLQMVANFSLIKVSFINIYPFPNQNDNIFYVYLINNYIYGNIYIDTLIIDNSYFPSGLIIYQNISNVNIPTINEFLIISNVIINNYNKNLYYDNKNIEISAIISISGFYGSLTVSNVTINSSFFTKSYYLLNLFDLNNNIFIQNTLIIAVYNFSILQINKCSVWLINTTIFNSTLQQNSLYIQNLNSMLTMMTADIENSILNSGNFLTNAGIFTFSNFLLINFTNPIFVSSSSIISVLHGYFISSSSSRFFIIDNCQTTIFNVSFYQIKTSISLFLFNMNPKLVLEALSIINVVSTGNIIEHQTITSINFFRLMVKQITCYYIFSIIPGTSALTILSSIMADLSFYRIFYVTVKITMFFQDYYLGRIPSITGSYVFQFMKATLIFNRIMFEEIYGDKNPYAMFHLSGGNISITNSVFLNIGWRTNDTSNFFSIDDNTVFYFFNEAQVNVDSCVFLTFNMSLHSGYMVYTGGGGILTLNNNFFKNYPSPNKYVMGLTMLGSVYITITNNFFEGLICPLSNFKFSRFQHINGPVAILGEAVYAKKKNKRIAIIMNNTFSSCQCRNGGSMTLINYNNVTISNCSFYNSTALKIGGSFTIRSIGTISFNNITVNYSETIDGAIGYLINIDSIIFNNSRFFNAYGDFTGGFQARNTKLIQFYNSIAWNLSTKGNGAFLTLNGFSAFLVNFSLTNTMASEGAFYILNNGDLSITNSTVRNCTSLLSGAFLSVDAGQNINLTGIYFYNLVSQGDAAALIINSVENFIANGLMFNTSKAARIGVLYFKCSNESATHYLTSISCLYSEVLKGSCVYYDSASLIIIDSMDVGFSIGSPLVFSWSFEIAIKIQNCRIYENVITDNIITIENIDTELYNIIAIDNSYINSMNLDINLIAFYSCINVRIIGVTVIDTGSNIYKGKIYVFSIENTNVDILDVYFNSSSQTSYNYSLIQASLNSLIFINNSIFKHFQLNLNGKKQTGGLINLDSSSISINSSFFIENSSPVFYIINSNISLNFSNLYENHQILTNSDNPNEIFIENSNDNNRSSYCIIENSEIIGSIGRLATITSASLISLINSNFTNSDPLAYYQSFYLNEIDTIFIKSCKFLYFYALYGAVLSVQNTITPQNLNISIDSSVFSNGTSYVAGSLYILSDCDILLINSKFLNNKAISSKSTTFSGIAGAIYLETFQSSNPSSIAVSSCIFLNNSADVAVASIYSSICLSLINTTFISPDDKNLNYLSFPLDIMLNERPYIKSGYAFNLSYQMIDCHNQTLSFEHESIGNLNAGPLAMNQTLLLKAGIAQANAGYLNFTNIKINIDPNSSFLMTITLNLYNQLTKILQKLQHVFVLNVGNCSSGEIQMIDKSCFRCPDGSYSSNEFNSKIPNICLDCPINAYCTNGNLIFPVDGYWRRSYKSTLMVSCLITEACLGFNNSNNNIYLNESNYTGDIANEIIINGKIVNVDKSYDNCLLNHFGNLCDLCLYGYGKYNDNSPCQKCTDLTSDQIVRAVIVLVLSIAYIIYSSKSIISVNNDQIFDIVAKIIINHIQRLSIIVVSEIQISIQDLKGFMSYFNYLNLLTQDIFSNDCFVQLIFSNTQDFYFYKLIIVLILPLLISTICFLSFSIYVVVSFFRKAGKKEGVRVLNTTKRIINLRNIPNPSNTLNSQTFHQSDSIISKDSAEAFPMNHQLLSKDNSPAIEPEINDFQKTKKFLVKKFVLFFLICSFLCYPLLIKSSMNLLNCTALDNTSSDSFLYQTPNVKCWDGIHKYAAAPTGVIGLVIWGLIFPLFLWKLIKISLDLSTAKRKHIYKANKVDVKDVGVFDEKTFHFFFKDYKKEFYFWECIVFIQKLMLNIFSQMKLWTDEQYARLSNILFLLFYFNYVHKYKPFSIKFINYLEFLSLFTAILTNCSTIGLSSSSINSFLRVIFYMCIGTSNIGFFIVAGYIVAKKTEWKRMYTAAKGRVNKIVMSKLSMMKSRKSINNNMEISLKVGNFVGIKKSGFAG